ncbi:MAG: hypothetical protein AAGI52_03235 [Bacteroidota bacterium]
MSASIVISSAADPIGVSASLSLLTRSVDAVRPSAEIEIEVKGHEYVKKGVPLLWKEERGPSLRITIKGKPGFCYAMIEHLTGIPERDFQRAVDAEDPYELKAALQDRMQSARRQNPISPEKIEVPWYAAVLDLIRFRSEIKVEVTGRGYAKKRRMLFYSEEEGEKLSVTIKGKPGFAQAVAAHLRLYGPRVNAYLLGG